MRRRQRLATQRCAMPSVEWKNLHPLVRGPVLMYQHPHLRRPWGCRPAYTCQPVLLRSRTIAIKERLTELGLQLPPALRLANLRFETVRIAGNRVCLAGHLPTGEGGKVVGPRGKVGAEVSAEAAYESARQIALAMISTLDAAGIDLDRVVWRKAFGMVNAAPGFNSMPAVIDGFSDVLLEVFGERGRHSRSAIGVAELPFGAPVEIEAEAELLPAAPAEATESAMPAPVPAAPADAGGLRSPPATAKDLGLRGADYVGFGPLSIPAEALVRSIGALSRCFWISLAGTVVTIFLASLANLVGHAGGSVPFGEYSVPLSVLPTACLCFAMFVFWLTASRLRMLEAALGDDDLTANMARDIFRLDPPVLNVFDAGNLRPFALLSGFAVLLWNWSLFLGSSMGLISSATIVRGAAVSVDETPAFAIYVLVSLAIGGYGVGSVVPPLRRILQRLHRRRLKIGLVRIVMAIALVVSGVLMTNPELPRVMWSEDWRPIGPAHANALDGETLMLEGGRIVVLVGIDALRPNQTCFDAEGTVYPCGAQATTFLQSLVQNERVYCYIINLDLGSCAIVTEGSAPPTLWDTFERDGLSRAMVAAGWAFAEGDATALLIELQDKAQRNRVGAWRGAFEPPHRWAARQGR